MNCLAHIRLLNMNQSTYTMHNFSFEVLAKKFWTQVWDCKHTRVLYCKAFVSDWNKPQRKNILAARWILWTIKLGKYDECGIVDKIEWVWINGLCHTGWPSTLDARWQEIWLITSVCVSQLVDDASVSFSCMQIFCPLFSTISVLSERHKTRVAW